MKARLKKYILPLAAIMLCFLAAGIFSACPQGVFASSGSLHAQIYTAEETGESDALLSAYRVPASLFSYDTDAGETNGSGLSRAFDGDFSTAWQSEKVNSDTFHARVTVTFSEEVALGGILYQASAARVGFGYPVILTVVTWRGEESVTDDCTSVSTADRVYFAFPEVRRADKVEFIFEKVNPDHSYHATAREICFLQPQSDMLNEVLLGEAYTDFTRTELRAAYREEGLLESVERATEKYAGFEEQIYPALLRAKKVRAGAIRYDSRRAFSTAPDAENCIERHGAVQSLARNYLKMASFGVDYQPTGIAAAAGSTFTVYVEAPEGDPLPSVLFTQTYSDWQSWKREFKLSRGINVFTVPDFIAEKPSAYTVRPENGELVSGGAVYLVNPYLESTKEKLFDSDVVQSARVKVYFEGGVFYPLYRTGEDPREFVLRVERYRELMEEDPQAYPDVAELFSSHALVSATASVAYDLFVTQGCDAAASAKSWDELIVHMLRFGGVAMEEGEQYYHVRNSYLRHNPRMAQPWGGAAAYAANGLLGFCTAPYNKGWGGLLNYGIFGWAVPHEFGHSFDIGDRTIGEVTNNMWAFDYQMTVEKNIYDRNNAMAYARQLLTPDAERDSSLRTYERQDGTESPFFEMTRQYTVWFLIESLYPGYWGKLENIYRFYDYAKDYAEAELTAEEIAGITQEERHVYLNSVAVGVDMGYYFDRWDFYFSTKEATVNGEKKGLPTRVFDEETASAGYKKLMEWARGARKFTDEKIKFWYLDYQNYVFLLSDPEPLYHGDETVSVSHIARDSGGVTLVFQGGKTEDYRHLGYEVLRDGKVIGFTVSEAFTDPEGTAENRYTVRAYDRLLHTTKESEAAAPQETAAQSAVCKIGGQTYDSLAAAVAAANAAEGNAVEILLLKDFETGAVRFTRSVTIRAEQDVTVKRAGTGDLFFAGAGCVLTLEGSEEHSITLDGGSFLQEGSLVRIEGGGTFAAAGKVVFRNNFTAGDGGAICIVNSFLQLNGAEVTGNRAKRGGGIANIGGSVARNLENTKICANSAEKGGGVYMDGAMTFLGGTIAENRAEQGGGIAMEPANTARALAVQAKDSAPLAFTGNEAEVGGALYVNTPNARATLDAASFSENTAEEIAVMQGQLTFAGNGCNFMALRLGKGARLFLKGGLPEAALTVTPEDTGEGVLILSPANQFTLTEEALSLFKVKAAHASLARSEEGDLVIRRARAKVTLVADGKETVSEVAFGEPFRLPREWDETRYVSSWQGSSLYKGGDEIEVKSDLFLTAVLAPMCRVTLSFPDGTERLFYLVPGEKFYLPETAENPKLHILGWMAGTRTYSPMQGVPITQDLSLSAVCEALFKVTVEGETADWEEYLGTFRAPAAPEAPEGKEFEGWLVNGKLCGAEEEISVTEDTEVTASFRDAEQKPHKEFPVGLFVGCIVGIGGVVFLAIVVVIMKREHDLKMKK